MDQFCFLKKLSNKKKTQTLPLTWKLASNISKKKKNRQNICLNFKFDRKILILLNQWN